MLSDNFKKLYEKSKDGDLNALASVWYEKNQLESAIKDVSGELKDAIYEELASVGKKVPGKEHIQAETDNFFIVREFKKSYRPTDKFIDKVMKKAPEVVESSFSISPKGAVPEKLLNEMSKYFTISVERTVSKDSFPDLLKAKVITEKDLESIESETSALKVRAK